MAKQNSGNRVVRTATGTVTYDRNGRKIGGTGKVPASTGNVKTVTRTQIVQKKDNPYATKAVKTSVASTQKKVPMVREGGGAVVKTRKK